uniref:MFS transporter n=1 Tax=uncultured Limosilactobacillus sp. TaxID=2837629 RepID=UPI0025F2E3FB
MKVSKYIYSLSLGHLFVDFSQGALAALLPTLIEQHHYNYAIAATLVFAMNLVSSIVQPLFGFLSDKYNTGWIIILAILITGIGFSSLGYVPTYALLVVGCLVCGIGIAAYHPDAAKLVNGLAGYNPGQGMSIFSFGGNIGFAIGPIMLTLVVNHLGIQGIGIFLIVAIIITLILLKLYPIMHRQSVVFWSSSKKDHSAKIALHGHNDWLHFSLLSMVLF